jgi:xylan 1,4-beta-xylosidase
MRPFVELSFMPGPLRSSNKKSFPTGYKPWVSPPQDYGEWHDLVRAFASHCEERYGKDEVEKWRFEVWNEPNLSFFWGGTREDYWKLYDASARAVKEVDPELKVGGPASAEFTWIPEMMEHTKSASVPLDFISTHSYPNNWYDRKFYRPHLQEWPWPFGWLVRDARDKMKSFGRPLELWVTEWSTHVSPFNTRWTPENDHETVNGAAMVCETAADVNGFCRGFSIWMISDIFEEIGLPGQTRLNRRETFHGGFGLFNIDGVPKPVFWAFTLLHHLDDDLVAADFDHQPFGVGTLATRSAAKVSVLVWNYHHPLYPDRARDVSLDLAVKNLPPSLAAPVLKVCRIDRDHGNPLALWNEWGRPKRFSPEQLKEIIARTDNVLTQSAPAVLQQGELRMKIALPAPSVVLVELSAP